MAPLEQIRITARDLRAASQAVQTLDPTTPIEITRDTAGAILTWPSNGTTGAVIHDGQIVSQGE
jgi:hypothetical protein